MKFQKTFGLPLAILFLTFSGLCRSHAQTEATPVSSAASADQQAPGDQATPMPSQPQNTNEKLNALETENQSLEGRLKVLEEKIQTAPASTAATPAAPGPAFGPGEGSDEASTGNGKRGVQNATIPFESGNELMYSESRYLSFTNPEADTEFRIGGYEWVDLDINNQSAVVSKGVTTYNYLNNPANNNNGFEERKAHLDFRASFDKFVGAAIGIESDKSTGVSLGVYHAYLYAKFDKAFVFQAGKMSNPLSLEGDQPSADLPFVEASMIANLTVNKDIGAMIDGKVSHFFEYALEIANGQQDNESSATGPGKPEGDFKALTGRLFFTPWEKSGDEGLEGLGFGGGGSVDNETGEVTESTNVWSKLETAIGGNSFMSYSGIAADGDFYHLDGQAYYYNGPFGFLGEHVDSIQTVLSSQKGAVPVQLDNAAWLAEVQWVFGGKAGFEGASVDHPFDPSKGQWGALELVARMDGNFIDVKSFTTGFPYAPQGALGTGSQVATAYGVGFNWWLNENFKFSCDGEETDFSGGNAKTAPEQIMVARAALIM